MARLSIHKATPVQGSATAHRCAVCTKYIKHLPAGQGWIHTETGAVAGTTPTTQDLYDVAIEATALVTALTSAMQAYTGPGQHSSQRWEAVEMLRGAEGRLLRVNVDLVEMGEMAVQP